MHPHGIMVRNLLMSCCNYTLSTVSNTTFFIYGFHVTLILNKVYFLKQRQQIDLCDGKVLCFL
jgi:uncharacterized membrane protein YciS (DUF1049 family)